jgi:hypothetical protein
VGDDISGLELSRQFFHQAVAPVLARAAPSLRYTAGRFGARSDAYGLDDAISRDHGWGPGCSLLLDEAALPTAAMLDEALRNELPPHFRGYPTSYDGMSMAAVDGPPIKHGIEISTPDRYLQAALGLSGAGLGVEDWLAADEQSLLEVTAGELFRDDLRFAETRAQLAFYPDDLRRHLMAVEWTKIAVEQAFPARAGSRGDMAGAAIVLARLAESAMRLCFYVERAYPPYAKWLGSAFRRLQSGAALHALVAETLAAGEWHERDGLWGQLVGQLINVHERAGLLVPGRYQPAAVYIGRPGLGLPQFERGGPPAITGLIDELRAPIRDPQVLALPRRLGSINQMVAWRDLEEQRPRWRAAFHALAHC